MLSYAALNSYRLFQHSPSTKLWKSEDRVVVYVLMHVEELRVFYVGCTRYPKARYHSHVSQANQDRRWNSSRSLYDEIRRIKAKGEHFELVSMSKSIPAREGEALEARLIACYGPDNLTNTTVNLMLLPVDVGLGAERCRFDNVDAVAEHFDHDIGIRAIIEHARWQEPIEANGREYAIEFGL